LKNRRFALVVAMMMTAVAGVALCAMLAAIAVSFYYRPTIEAGGSGGVGAVSIGFPNIYALVALLFAAAAVFVNLAVRSDTRKAGRAAIWSRRAHLLVTALTIIVPPFILPVLVAAMSSNASEPDFFWPLAMVVAGIVAAFAAIHAAFGVFAIRLLRRA
jgi:hypothetical protein